MGLLFVGVGAGIIVKAWRDVRRARMWPRSPAELVSAKVERRVSSDGDGGSRTTYRLVAQFRYSHPVTGAAVTATQSVAPGTVVSPDYPLEVVYDPRDPTKGLLPEATLGAASCQSGVAGVLMLLGLAALLVVAVMLL